MTAATTSTTMTQQQSLSQPSRVIPVIPIDENTQQPEEWALMELNGELLSPAQFPSKKNNDSTVILGGDGRVELGRLILGSDNKPRMILGSHELRGTVEKLKEPFTLLSKEQRNEDENGPQTVYTVKGVVKQKLIFNQYPKVIMRS